MEQTECSENSLFHFGSGYFRAKTFPVLIPQFLKPSHPSYLSVYEDGTDRVLRNVGI